MTTEVLVTIISTWVSRYVAIFSLATLLAWAGFSYFGREHWVKPVRDALIYLAAMGTLTLVLALRPATSDALFWPPVTWFCFAMLTIMELLWLSMLADAVAAAVRKQLARLPRHLDNPHNTSSGLPMPPR